MCVTLELRSMPSVEVMLAWIVLQAPVRGGLSAFARKKIRFERAEGSGREGMHIMLALVFVAVDRLV